MHLGIHDCAFFLFILRSMICINFKSIPGITESSLYSWDLWMGICWCFLFSFYCGCCRCGCQSPSCPVHLEKFPMGVDDEAHSMIHTGPLAVHIRLAMWWMWSRCSKRAPHWCWVRSVTGMASRSSIVSLILLFPSCFPKVFSVGVFAFKLPL